MDTYQAPGKNGGSIQVKVDPESNRLQLLEPFKPWDGNDIKDAAILIKAKVNTFAGWRLKPIRCLPQLQNTAHVSSFLT